MTESNIQRHAEAMLAPEGDEEITIVALFTALSRTADRTDLSPSSKRVALAALANIIIDLLQHERGRLDAHALDKQVRDTVRRAGGDLDNG